MTDKCEHSVFYTYAYGSECSKCGLNSFFDHEEDYKSMIKEIYADKIFMWKLVRERLHRYFDLKGYELIDKATLTHRPTFHGYSNEKIREIWNTYPYSEKKDILQHAIYFEIEEYINNQIFWDLCKKYNE